MKKQNKKIATITFHWATNYGAVLQAFALQKHLKNQGHETEIIDYFPLLTSSIQRLMMLKSKNREFFRKEKKIKRFRKKELTLSKRRYYNHSSLELASDKYSAVICGSDQIWNCSFTTPRRLPNNLSYFLDFAGDAKRIAYAASFGSTDIPDKMKALITPELEKFARISVREQTGAAILKDLGFEAEVVADPTLLLTSEDYRELLRHKKLPEAPRVFSYVLHGDQNALDISHVVCDHFGQEDIVRENNCCIYEWLALEKDAEFIVTNSFHGTVFALLFHTPFLTAAIKGSGMNDRIYTLLKSVGLESRIAEGFSADKINEIINSPINWDEVDQKIAALRERSAEFLSDI